ncbi:MAG TPA: DNA polymerase IV [Holophagaceae bacterium]|nr:DNA polymerase IV [Holophagaceae bacterium]
MNPGSRGRRIAHLDMDAFFASVELLERPELRGLPIVVGGPRRKPGSEADHGMRLGDYRGRGVATTCTYEARAFGVRSGMGLMKAATLAPEALLLPANFEAYRRTSAAFKAAALEICPVMEDRGIDEIFLDLTEVEGDSRELGLRLKAAVKVATGLTCSIGITPTKLLSKIASELQKPDGLTILRAEEVPTRIWPLSVAVINGVGPKAAEKLRALGLETIGQVAAQDPGDLVAHFGESYGRWLHEAAHGRYDSPLVTAREPKSISRETTFERDLHPKADREQLSKILLDLCTRLAGDLERKGVLAKGVGIKLRYDDFKTVTRDITLTRPSRDPEALREAARACLKRVDLDRRLRLLGVKAGTLVEEGGVGSEIQPGLFED